MLRRQALLVGLALFFGGTAFLGGTAVAETPRLAPGRVEIAVKDLHCATCAKKVARKLYAVRGVRKVSSSLKHDLLVVTLPANQTVPAATIWSAVVAGGVPPVELRFGEQRLDAEAMKPLLAAAKLGAVTR